MMNQQQTIKAFNECIQLQNTFNLQVNPEWKNAGYKWRRAMVVESAELLDLLGYKWWKNVGAKVDKKQVLLEVVDIFHFMLSEMILDGRSGIDLYNTYIWATKHTSTTTKEKQLRQVEEFMVTCLDEQSLLAPFFQLVVASEVSVDDLTHYYLGKNALNKFRQDNGYKDGTYQKMWMFEGNLIEDNKMLEIIIEGSGVVSFDVIYNDLKVVYDSMKTVV